MSKFVRPDRVCPCGLLMPQDIVDQLRFDLHCPRCGNHKVSEFKQYKPAIGPTPPTPKKSWILIC